MKGAQEGSNKLVKIPYDTQVMVLLTKAVSVVVVMFVQFVPSNFEIPFWVPNHITPFPSKVPQLTLLSTKPSAVV